jgi:peptidyl-prolyl cis-trans isomerase D
VLRVPAFRGIDGEFDREAYRFTLQQSGLSETDFEAGIREEISRTLLQGAVVSGTPLPDAYADALSQYVSETRAITWASVTQDVLTSPVAGATDAQLTAYYEANPDDFTKPETRKISYAWLTPNMIQDDVTVDEAMLEELYQDRIADFVRPERRLVERLVFVDEASAQEAAASLAGDQTFEGLVTGRGLDLADVDLGDVSSSDLGAAAEAVFAAAPGDVVGPINSSLGPALFRMNAVLAAEEITFEEARPDLREELSAARAARIIDDSIDQMNDLLAGGATVTDLADRTDLRTGTIDWSAGEQSGIAAYQSFRDAAAAIQVGDFPSLTQIEDGGIFALQLDEVVPPALRPLDEVRADVAEGFNAKATQEAVMAKAQELSQSILPLTGFDSLGLTPMTEAALTRRSFVGGTPPRFAAQAFDMAVGDVAVVDNGTGAIIIRLDGITAADPEDPQTAAQKQAAAENAAAGISQDIFDAFAGAVQSRTDVVINQSAINAVNAQFQ